MMSLVVYLLLSYSQDAKPIEGAQLDCTHFKHTFCWFCSCAKIFASTWLPSGSASAAGMRRALILSCRQDVLRSNAAKT